MSRTLILELTDQFFSAIQQKAEKIGIPAENLAVKLLQQNFSQTLKFLPTDTEKIIRREKFERHFGAIDLGIHTNLDNESIDADLAKEYDNNHEDN